MVSRAVNKCTFNKANKYSYCFIIILYGLCYPKTAKKLQIFTETVLLIITYILSFFVVKYISSHFV